MSSLIARTHARALVGVLAAVLAAASLTACASDKTIAADAKEATVVSMIPTFPGAAPLLVDSMKTDEAHGIDLDIQATGKSGAIPLSALLARDAEFAVVARQTVFDAAAERDDLVVMAPLYPTSYTAVIRKDVIAERDLDVNASPEQRIKDLKGLKIATPPTGSSSDLQLRAALASVGLDPDRDVELLGVGDTAAIVAGVKQGQFDAAFYPVGALENNIAAGDADLWLSASAGDLSTITSPEEASVFLVTRRDVIESAPDLVEATYQAFIDVQRKIIEDPDAVGKHLHETWLKDMDSQVFDLSWKQVAPRFFGSGKITRAQFDAAVDEMTKDGDFTYEELVYKAAQE